MKTQAKFYQWGVMLATLLLAISTSSCENNLIYEGEGDCGTYYNISFKYDYNMKYADAFSKEVKSMDLFVFDSNDKLVKHVAVADGATIAADGFSIPLELPAGDYELLAWAGLMNMDAFTLLADVVEGQTTKQELQVMLNSTNGTSNEDLKPLFHGAMPLNITSEPGTYNKTMSLVKDTNVIRILLQQSSDTIVAEKFRFEITADNGLLDYDNSLVAGNSVLYTPWSVSSGTANTASVNRTRADAVSVVVAELTINRMIDGKSPILTVWNNEENKAVLSIPIADYALLVKGNYNSKMSSQEYLDRQDEYNMTFFLDEDGKWLSASIIVNSWNVVLDQAII
ncbi:MAG: FimB/Mfa2 family fimbrial subunit [Alistipes sp.]|nr:FimB/Mfa2 family fimbrial subunit [Alistipes sp.]